MSQIDDILELIRKARMDTNAAAQKLSEAVHLIAALPTQPDITKVCPHCGVATRGPLSLAEHVYNSHNGPVPAHMLEAERLAGITAEEAA